MKGRVSRRFSPGDPAACLFAWLDSARGADGQPAVDFGGGGGGNYTLRVGPGEVLVRLALEASGKTMQDAGLCPSAALTLSLG